jgi:tetratricopeptide (TPR) repeat protein
MFRRILLSFLFFTTSLGLARAKTDTWIQISSPHFVVVTNANEKQGRRVADEFERMRSVFHAAFPKAQVDPGTPIIILAIKDENNFKALEPTAYLAKGSLKLGGLFLRTADKNYVLMRLDAEGDHPYSVIYHEYTHLLLSKSAEFMPLWTNEGLAEFYQNTVIHEKDAMLGEPSPENILLLRESKLLPLPVLFTVDQRSPYYHEENKGSIFYAESWALTHYLLLNDSAAKTHRMTDYLNLVSQQIDPVTAGTRAFGDLNKLQQELEGYIRNSGFHYFKMATTTEVDDTAFKMAPLSETQSDALRADFLAYNDRTADAESLLDQVLKQDSNNLSAHETKGFLEFRQGHLEDAKKWYAQAVQLDSKSYLAYYYFAAIAMSSPGGAVDQDRVESSLRTAIKLNPEFSPAFDRLAVFLTMQKQSLDEARMMELTAIGLDPANMGYRVNMANIWMRMGNGQNAVSVLRYAAKLAKTPQDSQMIDNVLIQAQEYTESQTRFAEQTRQLEAESRDADVVSTTSEERSPQLARRTKFVPRGPHRFLTGVLKSVRCDNPALDLTVNSSGKSVALHIDNYFTLPFSALGFQPDKDLNPCTDLENKPAKVEYVESANPSVTPQLISVELHK